MDFLGMCGISIFRKLCGSVMYILRVDIRCSWVWHECVCGWGGVLMVNREWRGRSMSSSCVASLPGVTHMCKVVQWSQHGLPLETPAVSHTFSQRGEDGKKEKEREEKSINKEWEILSLWQHDEWLLSHRKLSLPHAFLSGFNYVPLFFFISKFNLFE